MSDRSKADKGRSILPLELRDVVFQAGGKKLIKDMSFTLSGDRTTIVVGPNGAGKSLLLRLCHGLLAPHAGQVIWHGTTRGGQPGNGSDLAVRRHQAMVFQRPVMMRRSVAANVDYALGLRGLSRAERKARTEEVLSHTGLAGRARMPARVLSGGEQQKLALARAWALRPQVLFLDEPTASLDPAATHALEAIITAIRAQGTRIVMTTHDLGQARRLADEVMFLHRGRLLEMSPAERFFTEPANDLAQMFVRGELLWWRRRKERDPRHDP